MVGEVKIGVAERIEGRDRVRLKGNDETESLKRARGKGGIKIMIPSSQL